MDKVILTSKDIDDLISWRDEHVSLLRNNVCPVKAIEIDCVDSRIIIKGYRKGEKLSLYVYDDLDNKCCGHMNFEVLPDCRYKVLKDSMDEWLNHHETKQSIITVYASLMALMANGYVYHRDDDYENISSKEKHTYKSSQNKNAKKGKNKQSVTYLFKFKNGEPKVTVKGSHMSPNGIFNVRGHFRHYQNGKVIWISEYKKGTGRKRDKIYKLKGQSGYEKKRFIMHD